MGASEATWASESCPSRSGELGLSENAYNTECKIRYSVTILNDYVKQHIKCRK